MLRRINPGPAAAVPAEGIDLESAWVAASASIVAEHNRLADPRASADSIGPAQRWALDVLRDPTVVLPPGASAAEESLLVERSTAVRHALTAIRAQLAEGTISRDDAARLIVEVVESFGLQPVPAAPPRDPITEDDIGVVCWMAVLGDS